MVYGLPAWGDTPVDPHSAFTHLKNYPIDGGLVDGPVYGSIYKNLIGITLYQPDEYAGFTMALLRMISFAGSSREARAVSPPKPATREAPTKGSSPAATPVSAHTPVTAATANSATATAFDGDWAGFVARSNMTGMAGIVARNSELVSFQNNKLELVVPEAHRVYADRPYTEKLHAELLKAFGPGLRLVVRVGETSGASVAAIRSKARIFPPSRRSNRCRRATRRGSFCSRPAIA